MTCDHCGLAIEQEARYGIRMGVWIHRATGLMGCGAFYTTNARPYIAPVPREELAALNPGLDERGLARLQAFEQLLAEDDAEHGYQDPEG